MPLCTPGDPTIVMGARLQAILIFWLFITTNDCFTSKNPGLAALKTFDITQLPGMTAQDLANIVSVLTQDIEGPGAFQMVRTYYSTVLGAGNANDYDQSVEAKANHYTDHNCPASIGELMKALLT